MCTGLCSSSCGSRRFHVCQEQLDWVGWVLVGFGWDPALLGQFPFWTLSICEWAVKGVLALSLWKAGWYNLVANRMTKMKCLPALGRLLQISSLHNESSSLHQNDSVFTAAQGSLLVQKVQTRVMGTWVRAPAVSHVKVTYSFGIIIRSLLVISALCFSVHFLMSFPVQS